MKCMLPMALLPPPPYNLRLGVVHAVHAHSGDGGPAAGAAHHLSSSSMVSMIMLMWLLPPRCSGPASQALQHDAGLQGGQNEGSVRCEERVGVVGECRDSMQGLGGIAGIARHATGRGAPTLVTPVESCSKVMRGAHSFLLVSSYLLLPSVAS